MAQSGFGVFYCGFLPPLCPTVSSQQEGQKDVCKIQNIYYTAPPNSNKKPLQTRPITGETFPQPRRW